MGKFSIQELFIKKTVEKIIVNQEEPGQYNSLDDIILIPELGAKNWAIFHHKFHKCKGLNICRVKIMNVKLVY